jgi:tetratricopeptide (TPR) repeat protein
MEENLFRIESNQSFSKSKIWQLNRDFYQLRGISAFSQDVVPHNLTSNSFVGRTYAELILAMLKDLSDQGKTDEQVYILELGAGHGRLAYHIITHLKKLIQDVKMELPSFCYVISDIGKDNLSFFLEHSQFADFFKEGILDVAYFDAIESKELVLQYAKKTVVTNQLSQPIIALANYFFDSLPCELFHVKEKHITESTINLDAKVDPEKVDSISLIENLQLSYEDAAIEMPFFQNDIMNQILEEYRSLLSDSYVFFPETSMNCIDNIRNLSSEGLLLLSLDKGFHEVHDLESRKAPDVVNHGSFSIWVNFHALATYCEKGGGKALLPAYSSFHLEIASMLFLENSEVYEKTISTYDKHVNDFGPDDFNSIKKLTYNNIARLNIQDLLAVIRLSAYDSTFFIKLLPRIKELSVAITFNERKRIAETLDKVWEMYFSISEAFDLPYELGSVFYDLGFYAEALHYFEQSILLHKNKPDTYYNVALSYYQLRQDKKFYETISVAKESFPDYKLFADLEKLDMA